MANIKRANTSGITKTGSAVPDVPDAPTIGTATNVGTSRAYNNGSATVAYTAAATGGAVTTFTATSSPGGFTATGSSPITVTGLQSGTAYTFTVAGTNASATGPASNASGSITATTVPQAPTIGTFTDGGTGTTGTLSFTAGATGGSSITNYKVSTDNVTFTALSPAQTSSPLSLTGLSVGTATYYIKAVNANGDSSASSGVSGTVIQPTAFDSIATATGTGSSDTISFTSISGTYKHLQIRASGIKYNTGTTGSPGPITLRFNSVSTASYANHKVIGDGTNVAASGNASASSIFVGLSGRNSSNGLGAAVIDVYDYANTSKNKTVKSISGIETNTAGECQIELDSGVWLSTSAITSVQIINSGGSFATTATFALYGITG